MSLITEIDSRLISGALVRHARFMDVAIRLFGKPRIHSTIYDQSVNGLKLNGMFINLAFNNSYNIGETFNALVSWDKFRAGDWEVSEDPLIFKQPIFQGKLDKCYRHGPWSKIIVIEPEVKKI